jgi:3-hydroxybutyryl-CoA dehydratase
MMKIGLVGFGHIRNAAALLEELELKTVPAVGDSFRYPFTISQEQITGFARITGDTNPIHVDIESASAGEFGGCIVHGVLLLGVFSKIFGTILYADGQVVLGIETRFLSPARPELPYIAVVTVEETLLEKCQVIYRIEMFGDDGKEILRGSCRLLNRKLYAAYAEDR